MENLVIYLIKSSTLLLLFYSTYYFLLKNNTFFTTNRWFLILGIFCSTGLPLLSFQKIVWVEPVISTVKIIDGATASALITNLPQTESFVFSWEITLGLLYGIGVLVFLTQLVIEFYSLKKIIKNKNKVQSDGFEFIEVEEAVSPFSFFKKIVYNPSLFQEEELQNIIEHEKIHARQLHSLDVIIARIHCILFWWNPLVWLYKKAITQNLEFIADQNALAKAKDKKSYLLTLLKITTSEKQVAITNHFYQSLIKKRIVMLHTSQSKKHHSWKYLVVLPALVFFMLTYQVEVVAQEKINAKTIVEKVTTKFEIIISESSTDKEIYEVTEIFKNEFEIVAKFKKISRNKNGEIKKLSVTLSDKKGNTKVYDVSESEAIKPFTIFLNTDENGQQSFGFSAPKENQHLKNHFEAISELKKTAKKEGITVDDVKTETLNNSHEMSFKTYSSNDNITLIKEDKNTDYKKAYISLDGKEISVVEMEKIDPQTIGSISNLNSPNNDKLIAKYGEKARNGVILIETMEFEGAISKDEAQELSKKFKLDPENGSFIIHKRSQKSDIEFYKKYLAEIGINAKIAGIERNSKGFIMSMKFKLKDEYLKTKMSDWTTFSNPEGIPDIIIGRKNGKLILNTQ